MHALGSPAVHRYDITDLEAGTAIYARVSGHTLMSYGYTALSDPEFETPSNVQPGAPPAVRLWASSDSSITVHWDHPTVDGGAWEITFWHSASAIFRVRIFMFAIRLCVACLSFTLDYSKSKSQNSDETQGKAAFTPEF